MRLRSLLFVPGDRPERMEKALTLGADALILDLEDSVAPAKKAIAREFVGARLASPRDHGVKLLVRINPLDSQFVKDDIASIKQYEPDAIMLPKAQNADSIRDLAKLYGDLPMVLPIAAETAAGLFELGTYRECGAALCGLTWGAEDLSNDVGAAANRDSNNAFLMPYQLARSLALFASHAAGVPAIDTVYPIIQDVDGLKNYAQCAARDGFSGMLAIHPSQIPIINQAFTPSETQIAHAKAIIDAFKKNPELGVIQIDGKMIDAPHVKQAERLLARAGI